MPTSTPTSPARAQLEEELKRTLRLEADAAATLGYHDGRRRGLAATVEAHKLYREQLQAQLKVLPTTSKP